MGVDTERTDSARVLVSGAPPGTVAPAAAPVSTGRAIVACLAGWAIPGLGHMLLGRAARGALYAAVILALFLGGLAMRGKVYRPVEGEPLTYLAALGGAGAGVPFLAAHALGFSEGDVEARYYDYGNTFTLVAGLLNLLIVLDVFDIAMGRR